MEKFRSVTLRKKEDIWMHCVASIGRSLNLVEDAAIAAGNKEQMARCEAQRDILITLLKAYKKEKQEFEENGFIVC